MQYSLEYADHFNDDSYSDIIDVRSPAEYAEDHIPGAINLPVLNDAERARVGTLYKQVDPFSAKRLGAGLISANIAWMLTAPLAGKPRDYRPLIYCWRGGMRSKSLAIVCRQIGWRAVLLNGGYKRYRSWVRSELDRCCPGLSLIRISGPTGCGKTRLLHLLDERGAQVLDLEGLARHKGSALGDLPNEPQPSQKFFETQLVDTLRRFDPTRPVWVESESSRVGSVHCPPLLWERMKHARVIQLSAPRAQRVALLIRQYRYFLDDPQLLKHRLEPLKKRHGTATLNAWHELIDNRQWPLFVDSLLETHYDVVYGGTLAAHDHDADSGVHHALDDLSDAGLAGFADFLIDSYHPT